MELTPTGRSTVTANQNEYAPRDAQELSQRVQREPASNWNYLVPVTAALAWVGFWASLGKYSDYLVHNYTYPKNPINPELVEASKVAMISLGAIGTAAIPVSFVAATLRAGYQGCLKVSDGAANTARAVSETIQEACSLNNFLKPEGIIINTIAAPFAAPILIIKGLMHRGNRF